VGDYMTWARGSNQAYCGNCHPPPCRPLRTYNLAALAGLRAVAGARLQELKPSSVARCHVSAKVEAQKADLRMASIKNHQQ
jgi:hypothetical protein